MRYSQSRQFLDSFLNLERSLRPEARVLNLDRMRKLVRLFGHPGRAFFPVLIAGTKGKGSTGFFLESILREAGLKTGFYSSPHLLDPRERIRLNGRLVSRALWTRHLAAIQKALGPRERAEGFTYFEIMTLLAMLIFAEAKIPAPIFEVGMGGRLDATNVLEPRLVILTPVHLDHEEILGPTIARIAGEKAAVIRPGADVVLSPQVPEALRVIRAYAKRQKARLWPAVRLANGVATGLHGDFQKRNAGAALRAALLLKERFGFEIPPSALKAGLQHGDWPGRFQLVPGRPDVLLDAAHNPVSIDALVRNLRREFPRRARTVVFAAARDKKTPAMLASLGRFFDRVILTKTATPRAKEIADLLAEARPHFRAILPCAGTASAMKLARQLTPPGGLIVATGSFYLLGEVLALSRRDHA